MENKLKAMFDYQHFDGNKKLESMLMAAENRHPAMLSDDDLDMVSAAGVPNQDKWKRRDTAEPGTTHNA